MIEAALHPGTRAMMAYARSLTRGGGPRPSSHPPDPRAADRLFLLDGRAGPLLLSAVGAGVQDLFGEAFYGDALRRIMSAGDLALLDGLVRAVLERGCPGVLQALVDGTEGRRLGVEITLAPLDVDLAGPGRLLGYVQPLGGEAFHCGPIVALRLTGLTPPLAKPPRALRLVVDNP